MMEKKITTSMGRSCGFNEMKRSESEMALEEFVASEAYKRNHYKDDVVDDDEEDTNDDFSQQPQQPFSSNNTNLLLPSYKINSVSLIFTTNVF